MPAVRSEDHILKIISQAFGDYAPDGHSPASRQKGRQFGQHPPVLLMGRGDDCAELIPPSPMAVSTDLFLEDHHCSRRYFNPEQIGAKALAVNLSDLAAAGAVPQGFSMGLMCPRDTDAGFLEGIFSGMAQMARKGGAILTGGDITAAPILGFSITVWGGPVAEYSTTGDAPGMPTPFLRRAANAGDTVFVVGPSGLPGAGLARLGLERLEAQGTDAIKTFPLACAALLAPLPMLEAGQALARLNLAAHGSGTRRVSAMDLSDGLLRDAPRLLASTALGVDFTIGPDELHPEIRQFFRDNAGRTGQSPALAPSPALALALSGGDEYCLLCAAPPDLMPEVRAALNALSSPPAVQTVGKVVDAPGLFLNGKDLKELMNPAGFDHFQQD